MDVVTERIPHYEAGGGPDDMVQLEPPFVVTLKRSIEFPPQAIVILEGDGWHYPGNVDQPDWPTATVTAPDGKPSVIPNAMMETLTVEHILDVPGVWTFTVEWEFIDCLQTVSVRALPPQ